MADNCPHGAEVIYPSLGPDCESHACSWRVKMSACTQSSQPHTSVGSVFHVSPRHAHTSWLCMHTLLHMIVVESQTHTYSQKSPSLHQYTRVHRSEHVCKAQEQGTLQTSGWQSRAGPRLALHYRVSECGVSSSESPGRSCVSGN